MEKKFLALQNKNSDADFQNNEKFVQFKQLSVRDSSLQYIALSSGVEEALILRHVNIHLTSLRSSYRFSNLVTADFYISKTDEIFLNHWLSIYLPSVLS